MAGRASTSRPSISGWRAAAGFFLGLEALWWAANVAIFGVGVVNQPATAALLFIFPVALMTLTLLTVFLLIRALRGGIWLGLGLQGIVVLQGLVFIFATSLLGVFELGLGVVTALCLAATANERSRP